MELIWKHLYSRDQLALDSREHPVENRWWLENRFSLTEAAISPKKQSEKMAEVFFETMEVPALFIAPQPLLSLYSSGRGTGIVLDIGEGISTYFPVYDGFVLTPHIHRVDLGGREMTSYLQLLLRRNGHIFSTTSEFEVVREMKEACSECMTADTAKTIRGSTVDYVLPDGRVIQVKASRFCNQ